MIKVPLKLLLLSVWIGLFVPCVWLARKLKKNNAADRMVRACYAGCLRIAGVRVQVSGQVDARRPLLLVTNHLSYLDVLVIGSQSPIRFTPKSEIAGWPVIGMLCRLTKSIFIDRRTEKFNDMKEAVRTCLATGDVVCVFPEATTGNGIHMLPFKSAFFSLAEEGINGSELVVQPAAMTYTRIRKLPIDSTQWPSIAWYGDMDLVPHLLNLLKLGPITAELRFLSPVTISQCGDRKRMAEQCQQMIAQAVDETRERRPPVLNKVSSPFRERLLKLRKKYN